MSQGPKKRPRDGGVRVPKLIDASAGALQATGAFELLKQVRAENLWLANFESTNTQTNYRRAVGSFIATLGIETPEQLYAVDQAHVIAWRQSMRDAGYSQETIAARLAALSSLFRFLTDRQLTPANPVSGVKRPKTRSSGIGSGKSPTLTARQVRAMLDAPNTDMLVGKRDRAILHVYFYTGARCTEPTMLRVEDFRIDRDYNILDLTIKGDKRNTVAIHPECASAIREYLDAADHADDPKAFLFQPVKNGKAGNPISRVQCYRLFQKYAKKAGLPEIPYPHVARATMITHAYEAGLQGEDIQRTVGHASITTTEGYNHTAKKHRKSASFGVNY